MPDMSTQMPQRAPRALDVVAMMMIGMFDGNYWMAVRKTFLAETVSMNFVMAGMIPVMVVLAAVWKGSESPAEPAFWFRMSLAAIAGGVLAYPINYWLVASHLKHGCMTLPGADGPAPGLGHRSPEAHAAHPRSTHETMKEMSAGIEGMPMEMHDLSLGMKSIWIAVSFAALIGALWLTARWVPIQFSS